ARTDLYSFGAVLKEMAGPRVPLQLQEIIGKALEPDRALRYQRAAEIRSAFERLRLDRSLGGGRRIAGAGGLALAAALIGGGLYYRFHAATPLQGSSQGKDTIVLADFANRTGDSIFDDTLKQALAIQLEQSPFLNVLSE